MASRTATLAARLPRQILALTLGVTLVLGTYAIGVPAKLGLGGGAPAGSESADVASILAGELGYEAQPAFVLLLEGDQPVSSPAAGVAIDTVSTQIGDIDGVGAVLEGTPSASGLATTLSVHMEPGADAGTITDAGDRLRTSLDPGALTLTVAGSTPVAEGARDTVLDEAPALLLLVLPLLLLLLTGALGWRAALAATLGAVLAAVVAISLLGLIDAFAAIDAIAVPAAAALAAVLAVESAAALLHRYREEAATLGPGPEALEYSLHVVLKGSGVAMFSVGLVGAALLVLPLDWVRSIGAGVLAAAALAPPLALLTMSALIGLRPEAEVGSALPLVAEGESPAEGSLPFRLLLALGRGRSRGFVAILPILIVAALALPLRDNAQAVGLSGYELPRDQPAATAQADLAGLFGAGAAGPIDVLTDGPAEAPTVTIYRDQISRVPGVDSVGLAVGAGLLASFDATSIEPPGTLAARQTLARVAAVASPSPRRLGGSTAEIADSADRLASDLPLALLVALLGTAALWSILFRSAFGPLLALSAAIAPLAGIAAAIAVFGIGRLTGLLDYAPSGGLHLESYVVIGSVLLAVGLARGAQLATALREERMLGGGAAGSLARAGVLTLMPSASSTLIGVALAGVWIGSDLVAAQEIGLGLAAGLIADLVLTRMLLAPAAARLSI